MLNRGGRRQAILKKGKRVNSAIVARLLTLTAYRRQTRALPAIAAPALAFSARRHALLRRPVRAQVKAWSASRINDLISVCRITNATTSQPLCSRCGRQFGPDEVMALGLSDWNHPAPLPLDASSGK
jgi:hypothetical protein